MTTFPTPPPYDHDHENDVIYFARTNFRNQMRKFGIKTDDRRRHMYLIGKTGVGKTTLLENMVLADIYKGHGLCIVDPHGDFAEKIIDYIPEHRVEDVVYFNPADMDYPTSFNILESEDDTHKHLIASGLMGVFKKIWPDVWSARMEHIMNNCILALLENPGNTLLGINRILVDQHFRRSIIVNLRDPVVKSFWITEFEQWDTKFRSEAIAPIQNKVGQFLSTSLIRNIVGQPVSSIVPREMMDTRKIFIVNLAKGRIGEDASRLMGGMLITKMQLAAMERVDMLEVDRQDFYLYIDEFQNFATESFANILSEARKYRLALIMAHQYVEQLEEEVASAVFGNVGTIVSYRVGAGDAEKLAVEFAPRFLEEDLVNLPKFNIYLKLMIDGIASDPFSATTLPPIAAKTGSTERVIEASRKKYGHKRTEVEHSIVSWSESRPEGAPTATTAALGLPEIKPGRKLNEYDCTRCGKKLLLPVELDKSRPIYCETCIELVRAERRSGKGGPARTTEVVQSGGEGTKVTQGTKDKEKSLDAVSKSSETFVPSVTSVTPTSLTETEVIQKPVGEAVSLSTLGKGPERTKGPEGTKGTEDKVEISKGDSKVTVTYVPSVSFNPSTDHKRRRRRRGGAGHGSSSYSTPSTGSTSSPQTGSSTSHTPKPSSGGDELFPW